MENPAQKEWSRLARRTVSLVNFGWWADLFAPLVVVLALAASVTILILRSQIAALPGDLLLYAGLGLLVAAVIASFFIARRRFSPVEKGYVRLEQQLRLHNALSAARAGIRPWPRPPATLRHGAGLRFRWSRFLVPLLLAAAAVVAAVLIPIEPTAPPIDAPPNEPLSWSQMESWLDELDEEEVVDRESLEEIREQIEQLRAQDEKNWFNHSSLEATDSLASQVRHSIRELGKELNTAERSLDALQSFAEQLSESARDRLLQQYQDAVRDLQTSQLAPDRELLKTLQNLDPSQLSKMSPEDLLRLAERLKESTGACKKCLGMGDGQLPPGWERGLDLRLGNGLNPNESQGYPGAGGITRGPGTAPVTLSDHPTDLQTNNPEGVTTDDYSRASLGDPLSVTDGEHEIDKTITGPLEAGGVQSTGAGGDRIWRESLLPEEKAILKKFFE